MYQADARNLDPEIKLKRSIEESEREREGRRRHPVHIRNHGNTRGIDDNEASDFCLFICCSLWLMDPSGSHYENTLLLRMWQTIFVFQNPIEP